MDRRTFTANLLINTARLDGEVLGHKLTEEGKETVCQLVSLGEAVLLGPTPGRAIPDELAKALHAAYNEHQRDLSSYAESPEG